MAFENVGHTIQKIINNTPVSISANSFTTTVATNGGDVYMAGFIGNKIQYCFEDIIFNNDLVGRVIETRSGDHKIWVLNHHGSVYQFDYNKSDCKQQFHEIYCPRDCCGDKAIKIAAGNNHVVILTHKNRIYGAGDNSEYQLVPQGQCKYECAVELIITDTNNHDDCCCEQFTGVYNQLTVPVIPTQACSRPICFSSNVNCAPAGSIVFTGLTLTNPTGTVIATDASLTIPLFITYTVTGMGCVSPCGTVSGTITVTINDLFYGSCNCPTTGLPLANASAVLTYTAATGFVSTLVPLPYTSLLTVPITFTVPIPQCTACTPLMPGNILLGFTTSINPLTGAISVAVSIAPSSAIVATFILPVTLPLIPAVGSNPLVITVGGVPHLIAVPPGTLTVVAASTEAFVLSSISIPINCCTAGGAFGPGNDSNCCNKDVRDCCPIPQPCWRNVYAGFDQTVLVDSCNKLYVLGNIHKIRNNRHLLRKHCLEELLEKTTATVTLPADQLNCCVRPRNGDCRCIKCKDKCFKTDLRKFGIQLSFANGYCVDNDDCACPDGTAIRTLKNKTNVCDFLKALQNCNEYPTCDSTCEPCDTTIYLNVCGGNCGCTCGNVCISNIGSITLYNKRSVCKFVSQSAMSCISSIGGPCASVTTPINGPTTSGCLNRVQVPVNLFSCVEYDLNKYCIDALEVPLDQIVILTFGTGGTANVDLYLDICKPGGLKFVSCDVRCTGPRFDDERRDSKRYNIDFPLDIHGAPGITTRFALDYGCILDPVELTNFKLALGLACGFPCPCYRNPITNKLVLVYLRGGDRIRFTVQNNLVDGNICHGEIRPRLPVTADVPTVFCFRKRVVDVAVGDKNLTVIVATTACPNEVFAIGENCHGELGINGTNGITNNETVLCFRKLNRCLFDCQVERVFAGKHVTFYLTQSYRVYSSGSWRCLCQSNIPVCVPSICQAWKIIEISAAKNHIVLLGKDGCIFGFGDNSLGELGLCHCNCVRKPVPLVFFYRLNQCFAKKFYDNCRHPLLKNCGYDKFCGVCSCNPCKCQPCTPCPSICEEPCRRKRCHKCRRDPCECHRDGFGYHGGRGYIENDRSYGKRY